MCSGAQTVNRALGTFPDLITITPTAATSTSRPVAQPTAPQTVTRQMILFAPMFQLNYQSSDLESSSTSSPEIHSSIPTLTTPVGETSDTNSSASPASSSTLPTSESQSGLSTGAMAGIGVGAALGGIFLGTLAVLLFLRRRKRRAAQELGGTWVGSSRAPYSEDPEVYYKHAVEAPAYFVGELPADPDRFEALGRPMPVELAAGSGHLGHSHDPNRRENGRGGTVL